jgi:type VI protein secretion system component VasK
MIERWQSRRATGDVLRRTLRFLRRHATSGDYRYHTPWYLVLGETGAGKTALIRAGGLERPGSGTEAIPSVVASRARVQVELLNGAVLLEASGTLISDPAGTPARTRQRWSDFLRELVRARPRKPLNGIILVLSAAEFLPADAAAGPALSRLQEQADVLAERLFELQRLTEFAAPIYLVISKSDLVEGFQGYFASFPCELASTMLGWASPHPPEIAYAEDWAAEAFGSLQRDLIARRRELLGTGAQASFQDGLGVFPEAFRQLQVPVAHFLEHLLQENAYQQPFPFRGIFFTGELASAANLSVTPAAASGTGRAPGDAGEAPSTAATLRGVGDVPSAGGSGEEIGVTARPRIAFFKDLMELKILPERRLAPRVTRQDSLRERRLRGSAIGTLLAGGLAALLLAWGAYRIKSDQRTLSAFFTWVRSNTASSNVQMPYQVALDTFLQLARTQTRLRTHHLREWRIVNSYAERVLPDGLRIAPTLEGVLEAIVSAHVFEPSARELQVYVRQITAADQPFLDGPSSLTNLTGFARAYADLITNSLVFKALLAPEGGNVRQLAGFLDFVTETNAATLAVQTMEPRQSRAAMRRFDHLVAHATAAQELDPLEPPLETAAIARFEALYRNLLTNLFHHSPWSSQARSIRDRLDEAQAELGVPRSRGEDRVAELRQALDDLNQAAQLPGDAALLDFYSLAFWTDADRVPAVQTKADEVWATWTEPGRPRMEFPKSWSEATRQASEAFQRLGREHAWDLFLRLPATNDQPVALSPELLQVTNLTRRLVSLLDRFGTPMTQAATSAERGSGLRPGDALAVSHALAADLVTLTRAFTPLLTNQPAGAVFREAFPLPPEQLQRFVTEALDRLAGARLPSATRLLSVPTPDPGSVGRGSATELEAELADSAERFLDVAQRLEPVQALWRQHHVAAVTDLEHALAADQAQALAMLDRLVQAQGLFAPGATTAANLARMQARLQDLCETYAQPLLKALPRTPGRPSERPPRRLENPLVRRWQAVGDALNAAALQSPENLLLNLEDYIRLRNKAGRTEADLQKLSQAVGVLARAEQEPDNRDNFFLDRWRQWLRPETSAEDAGATTPFQQYLALHQLFSSRLAGKYPFGPAGTAPAAGAREEDLARLYGLVDAFDADGLDGASLTAFGFRADGVAAIERFVGALAALRPWFDDLLNGRPLALGLAAPGDAVALLYNHQNTYEPITTWPPSAWAGTNAPPVKEVFLRFNAVGPFPEKLPDRLPGSGFQYHDRFFNGTTAIYVLTLDPALEAFLPIYLARTFGVGDRVDLSRIPLKIQVGNQTLEATLSLGLRPVPAPLAFDLQPPRITHD